MIRELVHIDIEDVNEFPPVWKEQTYIAEVIEGQLFEQILKLETTDEDGSESFSKVCQFHLLTKDVPFRVSTEGNILLITLMHYGGGFKSFSSDGILHKAGFLWSLKFNGP